MTARTRTVCFGIVGLLLVGLITSCSREPKIHDQPALEIGGYYELGWVDPEMIMNDSLFSLIRANRVDSIWVDEPDPFRAETPSIAFSINEGYCVVSVNVLDERGRVVLPLLVQDLPPGHYKLTFQPDRVSNQRRLTQTYFLRVDYCDQTLRRPYVKR